MSALEIAAVPLAIAVVVLALLLRRRVKSVALDPSARRILFPFVGTAVSQRALDATLRVARAEQAVLVPAYLARVPRDLSLHAAMPGEAAHVLPVLDAIELRAARQGIGVDARIERGRTVRHALRELIAHEQFDRLVVAAATDCTDGFDPDDVAWLLAHAPCEILVLRPTSAERPLPHAEPAAGVSGVAPRGHAA